VALVNFVVKSHFHPFFLADNSLFMWRLYFDLETTGLSVRKDRITQIGAVLVNDAGEKIADFESLVKPDVPISKGSTRVTGISFEHVKNADTCKNVLQTFLKWLHKTCVGNKVLFVAYNGFAFDFPLLVCEMKRNGIGLAKHLKMVQAFHDPYRWFRTHWNKRHSQQGLKLMNIYASVFGEDFPNAHSALADSDALRRLCESEGVVVMFSSCADISWSFSTGVRKWLKLTKQATPPNLLSHKSFRIKK
jgi:DNA polymerase III epsilon subunit-like protein